MSIYVSFSCNYCLKYLSTKIKIIKGGPLLEVRRNIDVFEIRNNNFNDSAGRAFGIKKRKNSERSLY